VLVTTLYNNAANAHAASVPIAYSAVDMPASPLASRRLGAVRRPRNASTRGSSRDPRMTAGAPRAAPGPRAGTRSRAARRSRAVRRFRTARRYRVVRRVIGISNPLVRATRRCRCIGSGDHGGRGGRLARASITERGRGRLTVRAVGNAFAPPQLWTPRLWAAVVGRGCGPRLWAAVVGTAVVHAAVVDARQVRMACANPATTGTTPTRTNAGRKHTPSGSTALIPARCAAA
jgi:hypothetical protein